MNETPGPRRYLLPSVVERLLKIFFGIAGALSVANGAWMLLSPEEWYRVFPGAIADTGPLNPHFIRDLGGWYLAGGLLLLFAFANPLRFGGVTLVVVLVAFGVHAGIHVFDIASGRLPAAHWIIDAPLVFAPVFVIGILLWLWWNLQAERHPELVSDEEPDTDELEGEESPPPGT